MELSKNCIMSDCIHFYCLLCEEGSTEQHFLQSHLNSDIHINKLKSITLLENYEDDYIIKFKDVYYCQSCNILLPALYKVQLHTKESIHKTNKWMHSLQKAENGICVFNKILINENIWHGLMDNSCAICNVDFIDKEAHKNNRLHILNLIQNRVEFGEKDWIFRKVSGDSFHCLTCNVVLNMKMISKHSDDEIHTKQYVKCKQSYITQFNDHINENKENLNNFYQETSGNITTSVDTTETKNYAEKEIEHTIKENAESICTNALIAKKEYYGDIYIAEQKNTSKPLKTGNENEIDPILRSKKADERITKEIIDINCKNELQAEKKSCKNEFIPKPINTKGLSEENRNKIDAVVEERNCNKATSHHEICRDTSVNTGTIFSEVDQSVLVSPCEALANSKKFAKQNKLKYTRGKNNVYCRACDIRFSSSLKHMKEHVATDTHKDKVKKGIIKKPFKNIVRQIHVNENYILFKEAVINYEICISFLSLNMITINVEQMRCQLCETQVSLPFLEIHIDSHRHKYALLNTLIISSMKSEFVREIRGNLYHCGFCNLILADYEELTNHLKSLSHDDKKSKAAQNLLESVSIIKFEEEMETLT